MCGGATSAMRGISKTSTSFYNTVIQQAKSVFGDASSIFSDLVKTFSPIFAAGPNQHGFSAGELAAKNTAATETVAQQQAHLSQAMGARTAAAGGSDYVPSGAAAQLQEQIGAASARELASEKNNIEMQDYATGRANWSEAAKGLAGAPSVFGVAQGFDTAATKQGEEAFGQAKDIYEADKSSMSWGKFALGAAGMGLNMVMPGVGTAVTRGVNGILGNNGGGGGSNNAAEGGWDTSGSAPWGSNTTD